MSANIKKRHKNGDGEKKTEETRDRKKERETWR